MRRRQSCSAGGIIAPPLLQVASFIPNQWESQAFSLRSVVHTLACTYVSVKPLSSFSLSCSDFLFDFWRRNLVFRCLLHLLCINYETTAVCKGSKLCCRSIYWVISHGGGGPWFWILDCKLEKNRLFSVIIEAFCTDFLLVLKLFLILSSHGPTTAFCSWTLKVTCHTGAFPVAWIIPETVGWGLFYVVSNNVREYRFNDILYEMNRKIWKICSAKM